MLNRTSKQIREDSTRLLSDAQPIVRLAIQECIQENKQNWGVEIFSTADVMAVLRSTPTWSDQVSKNQVCRMIRDMGFELTPWATPRPVSIQMKVWKRVNR